MMDANAAVHAADTATVLGPWLPWITAAALLAGLIGEMVKLRKERQERADVARRIEDAILGAPELPGRPGTGTPGLIVTVSEIQAELRHNGGKSVKDYARQAAEQASQTKTLLDDHLRESAQDRAALWAAISGLGHLPKPRPAADDEPQP